MKFELQKGFTLIEMLMVMAVMGIVLALGINWYVSYNRSVQLSETTQQVTSFLRNVQETSLVNSMAYRVTYVPATNVLQVRDSSNALVRTSKLRYGSFDVWSEDVWFLSRGLPQKQYQMTLKNANKTRQVFVLVTGKVISR